MTHRFYFNEDGLTGQGFAPDDSVPEKLIFLLHGFMGDAESNMEFAKSLSDAFPRAMVIVPDGFFAVPDVNDGYNHRQWFFMPKDMDGSKCAGFAADLPAADRKTMEETAQNANEAAERLNEFILRTAAETRLTLADCVVAGISQGGMTAFEMVAFRDELRRDRHGSSLGALVIIGAGMLYAERLRTDKHVSAKIPVFLARGARDDVFPRSVDAFSKKVLTDGGFTVETIEVDSVHFGLEHVAKDGITAFLKRFL